MLPVSPSAGRISSNPDRENGVKFVFLDFPSAFQGRPQQKTQPHKPQPVGRRLAAAQRQARWHCRKQEQGQIYRPGKPAKIMARAEIPHTSDLVILAFVFGKHQIRGHQRCPISFSASPRPRRHVPRKKSGANTRIDGALKRTAIRPAKTPEGSVHSPQITPNVFKETYFMGKWHWN